MLYSTDTSWSRRQIKHIDQKKTLKGGLTLEKYAQHHLNIYNYKYNPPVSWTSLKTLFVGNIGKLGTQFKFVLIILSFWKNLIALEMYLQVILVRRGGLSPHIDSWQQYLRWFWQTKYLGGIGWQKINMFNNYL